jgi:hypothetical protein
MSPKQIGRTAALLLCLPLASAFSQSEGNLVEERVTYEGGAVRVCGESNGLSPCLDANGQTYKEEVHGPDLNSESEAEMIAEAARIRAESPEELNQTVGEMEQGYNPDVQATEGLPH